MSVIQRTVADFNRKGGFNNVLPQQYSQHVRYYANRFGVNENLARTLIHVESRGNHGATSHAGAMGFTQLMPLTAGDLKVNPRNPVENIKGGIDYLSRMIKTYNGDYEKAIAAYNAGPGNVNKAIRKGGENWRAHLPAETRTYLAQYRAILNNGRPL